MAGPYDEYLEVNRKRWDELTGIHARSAHYDVEGFKAGGTRLFGYEIGELGDVSGKSMLHLMCHFGLDTLSWARLGARAIGVDVSQEAVDLGNSLARELRLDATFVRSDVYELPDRLKGEFDIVYTSRGVLGWLPDLGRWAEIIVHFLKPGGLFYLTEVHPFAQIFDDGPGVEELRPAYPYFHRKEPIPIIVKGTYADRDSEVENVLEFGWVHHLGEVLTALGSAGLRLEFLHEFPFTHWDKSFLERQPDGTYRYPPKRGELPLTFSLAATKPAG
jgi:SAM-dependent methyltransferase